MTSRVFTIILKGRVTGHVKVQGRTNSQADFPTSISEGQFSCSLFFENRYLIKKEKANQ